jgi:carboxylate-amine ligase
MPGTPKEMEMGIKFQGSKGPTIGVEMELQLLDPDSLNLASVAQPILKTFPRAKWIKPELIQSTIELNTDICRNPVEARDDLARKLERLFKVADRLGCRVASAGTHPFSAWAEQKITPKERYRSLVQLMQWPAKQLMIFGLHVHVGIESGEKAIAIHNSLGTYIPHLLALSASSPFWQGQDTGLASARVKVFEALPTAGLPYRLVNWGEFQRLMRTLIGAGTIKSIREIWWDIRPHPIFGTVEVRVCDAVPTLRETMAIAAMTQSLVVHLGEQYEQGIYLPVPRHWIIRENKWRAGRFGLDAEIIVDEEGRTRKLSLEIENLLETLAPVYKRLGSMSMLDDLRRILADGPPFVRLRKAYSRFHDLRDVVAQTVAELEADRPLSFEEVAPTTNGRGVAGKLGADLPGTGRSTDRRSQRRRGESRPGWQKT